MKTAWTRGGKLILDSLGRVILCDECPCVGTGTGTGTGTSTVIVDCCPNPLPLTLFSEIEIFSVIGSSINTAVLTWNGIDAWEGSGTYTWLGGLGGSGSCTGTFTHRVYCDAGSWKQDISYDGFSTCTSTFSGGICDPLDLTAGLSCPVCSNPALNPTAAQRVVE